MAEPVKIFDYQSPENVEAEVPGAQTIREARIEDETGEALNDGEHSSKSEYSSQGEHSSKGESSSKQDDDMTHENPENGEPVPPETEGEVETRQDRHHVFSGKRNGIHGEPVMLNKGGEKKSRTKIPISRFRQSVEKVKEESRAKKELESHIPVRRSSIPKPIKEKLPPNTVIKEITITKTVIKNDSAEPVVTKTVVTKETTEPSTNIEAIATQMEIEPDKNEPEDEFDKIYAEIVVNTPTEVVFDDNLLNPKVEDPEKLESKFEEIIHDYDEHKVEPIDVEVVKRSKLPLLKRKSQQDIELSAQTERTSKIIAARDKLRLKYSISMEEEDFEDALDDELQKTKTENNPYVNERKEADSEDETPKVETEIETETKHEIITTPNSKTEITRQFTKTISTSSDKEQEIVATSNIIETTINEVSTNVATSNVIETAIFKEVTNENNVQEQKQHFIIEENIMKDSIRVAYPIFDSFVDEYSQTDETAKTTEDLNSLSYTQSEDLSISNNDFELKNEVQVSEIENDTETNIETAESYFERQLSKNKEVETKPMKYENEFLKSVSLEKKDKYIQEPARVRETKVDEDVQLRSKVERMITKIDSKEVIETERNQRESINELKKKKSVLSKIAMFEKKPEEPILIKPLKKESKLPKLITKDWQTVEHVHVHTPLIVDEVFKSFTTVSYNDDNKAENPLTNDTITIVRAESVTVESPDTVHYAAENKVQIDNKTEQGKPTELISYQTNVETIHKTTNEVPQANINSEYTLQKVEIATITDIIPSKQSNITTDLPTPRFNANIFEFNHIPNKTGNPTKQRISREISTTGMASPKIDAGKFDFKDARDKALSPTRLSMTKELQSPVVIPGFKPVSELLRSFESKEEASKSFIKRSVSKDHKIIIDTQAKAVMTPAKVPDTATITSPANQAISTQISHAETYNSEIYDDFDAVTDYKSLDDVFSKDTDLTKLKLRQEDDFKRAKSLAESDLGDAVKGKVNNLILRMKSVDRIEVDRKEAISKKEMPRKRSVSEKIALFEGKLTPSRSDSPLSLRIFKADLPTELRTEQKNYSRTTQNTREVSKPRIDVAREKSVVERIDKNFVDESRSDESDLEVIQKKIEELSGAKVKYGKVENLPVIEFSNGVTMPAFAVGTALLDPRLTYHIIAAAIDLGYRAIDTAFIYGNEREVGDAIRDKIADGTVRREELFIISKLWSTYHRTDLVEGACRASLQALGLDYIDLYLIHNPMSFKEGGAAIPRIATVIQYSERDYLDAWYGMEQLVSKGLVRAIGVSNFNSVQLQRVLDKGRVKPVVNQVECHPYLSQQRLDLFCSERNVTLSCFGVLGSKGTPLELKNGQPAVIDDALVQVMASGLGVTPAQLLISYQLENNHSVVVKASSAHHLHENLLAARVHLTTGQVDALHALNRNKRMFTFRGMGDTHKNYPFNVAF